MHNILVNTGLVLLAVVAGIAIVFFVIFIVSLVRAAVQTFGKPVLPVDLPAWQSTEVKTTVKKAAPKKVAKKAAKKTTTK